MKVKVREIRRVRTDLPANRVFLVVECLGSHFEDTEAWGREGIVIGNEVDLVAHEKGLERAIDHIKEGLKELTQS